MLMLNSSTFSCSRYGCSLWPIWSFRVADVVVADMVQTPLLAALRV